MSFRLEVCANSSTFGRKVIDAIRGAASLAGAATIVDIGAHEHGPSSVTTVLVAASDQDHADPLDTCIARAIQREQLVIPVIDDAALWNGRHPEVLAPMNAVALNDTSCGQKVLEAAGVLVPLRGVFLSHRRSDGGAMALQLAAALRRHGVNTFIDVLDIAPNEHVEARILAALDKMACLVLLESPEAIASPWVAKEVVYAQERHLGVLSLCWADEEEPAGAPRRFAQFDAGNRIDLRSHLSGTGPSVTLSENGVELATASILHEFVQALYFRRANLEREVLAAAPSVRRTAPWLFELRNSTCSRLIGLAPYRPDALDLHKLAVERDRRGLDDAVLVHGPISSDTAEALMLTWVGAKGPEVALDTERLDELLNRLEGGVARCSPG